MRILLRQMPVAMAPRMCTVAALFAPRAASIDGRWRPHRSRRPLQGTLRPPQERSTWRLRQVLDSSTGIDGYRYLRTMLVELPKAKTVEDFEALLPWRLATAER
jgi:IS66 C-terminal element